MRRALSVPGNVLLLGEYAVTEPGGLGIALGSGPRALGESEPAEELSLTARFGAEERRWPEEPLPLVEVALDALAEEGIAPEPQRLEIDTSRFYRGGRKLGFGSSAAATVLLTAHLLSAAPEATLPEKEELFHLALKVHRRLQGGRGSGYDVAASIWGGTITFAGGKRPEVKRAELSWLPRLYALAGREAVKSGSALESYNRWKVERPEEGKRFLRRSNELVREVLSAESWEKGAAHLKEAKRLGEELGRRIGVNGSFRLTEKMKQHNILHCDRGPVLIKSVGAGSEMGVLFTPCEVEERGVEAVELSQNEEGLRWE